MKTRLLIDVTPKTNLRGTHQRMDVDFGRDVAEEEAVVVVDVPRLV